MIFYKDELDAEWKPHHGNPVKCDVTSARPGGGIFRYGEHLYRPAQDSSVSYGGALSIQRIEKLTVDEYREVTVMEIPPLPQFPDGIHTLHVVDEDYAVIDGKRYQFCWTAVWLRLKASRQGSRRRRELLRSEKLS